MWYFSERKIVCDDGGFLHGTPNKSSKMGIQLNLGNHYKILCIYLQIQRPVFPEEVTYKKIDEGNFLMLIEPTW